MLETTVVTWDVPECPFTVECSARTLDDIRLVITDAFFSLARGGLEVGGILLGQFDGKRLTILEYEPLECEHAHGPSFTISSNDRAQLRALLRSAPANHPGLEVVGWYHSHTRSGIHLSDEDLEIYQNFFPEPYQVALVMKPHTFDPARIGFFFRADDGTVYARESYKELALEPLPVRQVPSHAPPATEHRPAPEPARDRLRRRLSHQMELDVTAETVEAEHEPAPPLPIPVTPAAAAPEPEPEPEPAPIAPPPPPRVLRPRLEPKPEPEPEPVIEHRLPSFAAVEPEPSSGRGKIIVWTVLGAAATLGLIFGATMTRDMWMSKFVSAVRPSEPVKLPPLPPPSMGLHAADRDGQLDINWDRMSLTVRQAAAARLEISDGGPSPQTIQLDGAHLQAGVFTYGRQSDKVDVKLIVRNAEGKEASEATTYVGKLPDRKPPPEFEEAVKKQREEMAAQAAKMKADLNFQAAKTKKLEKQLDELRQQQQKRMQNQIEGKE
jgi:proteasome lid subunit RPN8/RPN11